MAQDMVEPDAVQHKKMTNKCKSAKMKPVTYAPNGYINHWISFSCSKLLEFKLRFSAPMPENRVFFSRSISVLAFIRYFPTPIALSGYFLCYTVWQSTFRTESTSEQSLGSIKTLDWTTQILTIFAGFCSIAEFN